MRKCSWLLFLVSPLVWADAPEISVRIRRSIEHGTRELYSLQCVSGGASCLLTKARNSVFVGEITIPRDAAAQMLQSFSKLVPQGMPEVTRASGTPVLEWEIDTGSHRYQGALPQASSARQGRERFVADAVLSLEGAIAGQFLR